MCVAGGCARNSVRVFRSIGLERNNLTTLPEGVFASNIKLSRLYLGDNPLPCVPLTSSSRSGLSDYSGPTSLCSGQQDAAKVIEFGSCSFYKSSDGVLSRTGACPAQNGTLKLSSSGIKSLAAGVFDGMARAT